MANATHLIWLEQPGVSVCVKSSFVLYVVPVLVNKYQS